MTSTFDATETRRAGAPDASLSQPVLRIAPGASGVSIWSHALFADAAPDQLRAFIARAFSIDDVAAVEIRRDEAFARIHYAASGNPRSIWRQLSRAIRGPAEPPDSRRNAVTAVNALYLGGPANLPLEVRRVGASLSSWRVRHQSGRRIRVSHPILLRRRDIAYRLEAALAGVLGVQRCRANTVSGSMAIGFDPALISPERLARQLEQFWPVVLDGLDGPPSRKRLLAAAGLFGLAATGQFFAPAVRPLAVLGVVIYGAPNVTTALRQLRRFQVGLPALYAFGLGMMLLSGMPFNATLFAVLMQSWPQLAQGTLSRSRRRLFAVYRQPTWARLCLAGGGDIDVDVETLKEGDVIAVRTSDVVPADGRVVEGLAAVDEESLSGVAGAVDKTVGDSVHATSYVREGHLRIRVGGTAVGAVAREIARVLSSSIVEDLPSALEAERIANRNARPALALAVASLFVRQLVRPSQAIIRPDYITAYRLGAQLAALHDLGAALHQGIAFRRPGALDLLAATDIYVIDESPALHRRQIAIAAVFAVDGVPAADVVRFAASAFPPLQNERVRALHQRCDADEIALAEVYRRRRAAGAVAYVDENDHRLEIGAAALHAGTKAELPATLKAAIDASPHAASFDPAGWSEDHLLRPLIVRRDDAVIGAIAFSRAGPYEAAETVANLRTINRRARFVHVSTRPQAAAEKLARRLGIETVVGGLDASGKARVIEQLGPRTLWVGDGTTAEAGPAIAAAQVSVSVAGFQTIGADAADVVFLHPSLMSLVSMRRVARDHRARLDGDYRAMYAVNLTGVGGALLANFGGVQSGLISNAGTAYVYLRHRHRLLRLVARLERLRALRTTPGLEDAGQLSGKISVAASDAEPYVEAPRLAAPHQVTQKAEGI